MPRHVFPDTCPAICFLSVSSSALPSNFDLIFICAATLEAHRMEDLHNRCLASTSFPTLHTNVSKFPTPSHPQSIVPFENEISPPVAHVQYAAEQNKPPCQPFVDRLTKWLVLTSANAPCTILFFLEYQGIFLLLWFYHSGFWCYHRWRYFVFYFAASWRR